jgi:putative methanogenesis marker protein 1
LTLCKFRKVDGTQRVLHPADTLERVRESARSLGVTRLADITGLDRIGIPVYSAIVPRSDDGISVYTGKGLHPIEAKVGALMEAIERQTALKARLPLKEGRFEELRKRYAILDPRDSKDGLSDDYSEARSYSWVWGKDLMSDTEVLVPANWAGYLWKDIPLGPCFQANSSNGLSSGNVKEEAICQALCELVERDAWTLADIGAHLLPWVRRRVADPENANIGPDDFEVHLSLELDDDPTVELFQRAGLNPVLHDITSDLNIPTVFAAVQDEMIPGFPMVHGGVGTHPDARVAARRALTEAAQSRCVDIQGVREDLLPADAMAFNVHTRRISTVNRKSWSLNKSTKVRRLADLPSAIHDDIQSDIDHILSRLRSRGINQVIVVDLTPSDAPYAVVRVIVPALETWSVNHGLLGQRALEYWRANA